MLRHQQRKFQKDYSPEIMFMNAKPSLMKQDGNLHILVQTLANRDDLSINIQANNLIIGLKHNGYKIVNVKLKVVYDFMNREDTFAVIIIYS